MPLCWWALKGVHQSCSSASGLDRTGGFPSSPSVGHWNRTPGLYRCPGDLQHQLTCSCFWSPDSLFNEEDWIFLFSQLTCTYKWYYIYWVRELTLSNLYAVVFFFLIWKMKGREWGWWGKKPIFWERAVIIIHSRQKTHKVVGFRERKSLASALFPNPLAKSLTDLSPFGQGPRLLLHATPKPSV